MPSSFRGRPHAPLAVLMLDLDDFKTVNDSLGHSVGDELLNVVGQRLTTCIRPGDTAARLGGDEYAVLLETLAGPAATRVIAQRIFDALRKPITLGSEQIVVTASIGIALAPRHGEDPATLLRHADIAMYESKSQRRGTAQTFHEDMESAIEERLRLTADLNRAVERLDQFELEYQPIVNLADGTIVGLEALVRWQHPDLGLIPPDRFIPLAEQTGLIIPIGRRVIQTACAQGARWNAALDGGGLAISVNVSSRQLEDPAFAETVADALRESALPAENLLLEVTESVLMRDVDEAVGLLSRIKELGVRVAIDDFGTGYSSLSQLGRLPVDMVKIDKSFVDDLTGGRADSDLAGVIVQLGTVLRLETVAEGIEMGEQVAGLRELQCALGQGFYFARPMPASGVTALMEGRSELSGAAGLAAVENRKM
jgi:diguanylate cyclase (GGDEF)-like protein